MGRDLSFTMITFEFLWRTTNFLMNIFPIKIQCQKWMLKKNIPCSFITVWFLQTFDESNIFPPSGGTLMVGSNTTLGSHATIWSRPERGLLQRGASKKELSKLGTQKKAHWWWPHELYWIWGIRRVPNYWIYTHIGGPPKIVGKHPKSSICS